MWPLLAGISGSRSRSRTRSMVPVHEVRAEARSACGLQDGDQQAGVQERAQRWRPRGARGLTRSGSGSGRGALAAAPDLRTRRRTGGHAHVHGRSEQRGRQRRYSHKPLQRRGCSGRRWSPPGGGGCSRMAHGCSGREQGAAAKEAGGGEEEGQGEQEGEGGDPEAVASLWRGGRHPTSSTSCLCCYCRCGWWYCCGAGCRSCCSFSAH